MAPKIPHLLLLRLPLIRIYSPCTQNLSIPPEANLRNCPDNTAQEQFK